MQQLLGEQAFYWGIVLTLGIEGIVLLFLRLGGAIGDAWAAIRQFFESTQTPGQIPAGQGPSPFQYLLNLIWGVIRLVALTAGVVALLGYLMS